MLNSLFAISPVDGRYSEKTNLLSAYTSEAALMKYRLMIEIEWLIFLSEQQEIVEIVEFSIQQKAQLRMLITKFSIEDAEEIKKIEKTTQHDLKAVEYYLKNKLKTDHHFSTIVESILEFIHFACTSEDINNIAYALMLKDCREKVLNPVINQLLATLTQQAHQYASISMLARTHGQAATPTTLGKEFANVVARLQRQHKLFNNISITAKINGATGNFNAHVFAYPNIDWPLISKNFIEGLGLDYNLYTTQIEPHDFIAEYAHALIRLNTIFIDFSRDMWGYISLDYFKQSTQVNQIGSSTMPHKINPIDFENAEGNLGVSNALFNFFAEKLPISRWQRDLSDSTVLRNLGVAIAHSLLAYTSLYQGLNKLNVNQERIAIELNQHWEILTESIQTLLRKHGVPNPYEQLKNFSQGKLIQEHDIKNFIESLDVAESIKSKLQTLTPESYIGLASVLAKKIVII